MPTTTSARLRPFSSFIIQVRADRKRTTLQNRRKARSRQRGAAGRAPPLPRSLQVHSAFENARNAPAELAQG